MNPRQTIETRRDGGDKELSLEQAVRRYVAPGMKLHLAAGIGGPSAAICEIIRQYRGTTPGFTIIQSTISGHALNLVHCDLVRKLICSVCADISAAARPSKIIQKAVGEKRIVLENWSLLSLQQRLMAGAQGVPFLTTRSVLGSSIASDNGESFREMEDPFGSGEKVGLLKALNPDISIIHGCVGDREGNIIINEPMGEDLWGSLASVNGVLATVEKIVSTDEIRSYAALVKIPGYLVKAVCVTPLGLHPFSLPNPGIGAFDPYEKDVEFLNSLHEASKKDETLDSWIREWIVDCPTHRHYLDKLGQQRVGALTSVAGHSGLSAPPRIVGSPLEFTPEEMVLIAVAREIVRSVRASGHRMILSGAGSRGVAAFVAYYQLKAEGHEIELIAGNGQIGFTPLPGLSILSTEAGVRSCKMLTDTTMAQGVFIGGRNNRCLSVLGAGQVDKYGNINSTMTAAGRFLVGSGGANDAMNAREVIVALDQSKERFVEELSYVTAKGRSVTTVISTMGVFRKSGIGEELHLAACLPDGRTEGREERIRNVQDRCGWSLKVADPIEEIAIPDQAELDLLRWLQS